MVVFPKTLLDFLPFWYEQLQQCSLNGRLSAAAQEALLLDGEPQALHDLVNQWSLGDFQAVPEIVLLSNADINGALGAYAISTGKIYLNADWFATATQEAVNAVLTEELGHHLDGLLNTVDTSGDEGEYFSRRLIEEKLSAIEINASRAQLDQGMVQVGRQTIQVEQAGSGYAIPTYGYRIPFANVKDGLYANQFGPSSLNRDITIVINGLETTASALGATLIGGFDYGFWSSSTSQRSGFWILDPNFAYSPLNPNAIADTLIFLDSGTTSGNSAGDGQYKNHSTKKSRWLLHSAKWVRSRSIHWHCNKQVFWW